mmetsp:Transcript_4940/g.14646  ORF Transcript_4940/g.14646 Transcript_4940/m.14646 type:complete len:318 (-) Transcript_4940:242-1195(-)
MADPEAAALRVRVPFMTDADARVHDVAQLTAITFEPTGDAAADTAAWAHYCATLSALVPCLRLSAGGIQTAERPAAAILLKRIFDVTLKGAAADAVLGQPNGITKLATLHQAYAEAGNSARQAIAINREAIANLAYDRSTGLAGLRAQLEKHQGALVAYGKGLDAPVLADAYMHAFRGDRCKTFDASHLWALWATPGAEDYDYADLHEIAKAHDPPPPKAHRARALVASVGGPARSGDTALADLAVAAAIATLRIHARQGLRCGNCGVAGHYTQLCPSVPGAARRTTPRAPAEHDSQGREICRQHQAGRCTRGDSCR